MTFFKLTNPPKNNQQFFQISKALRYCENLDGLGNTKTEVKNDYKLTPKELTKFESQGFVLIEPMIRFDYLLQHLPSCEHYEVIINSLIMNCEQPEAKLHTVLFDHLNKLPKFKNKLFDFTSWISQTEGQDGIGQLIIWSF